MSRNALEKTRLHLLENHLDPNSTWLPCHAIDLKRDGELRAHVDSVRFSGGMVAGISFLSSSIMRLRPGSEVGRNPEEGFVDLLLPPLSLYVLTGVSRYEYAHELLPSGSIFESLDGMNVEIEREHRVSVIFRDAKHQQGEFTFPMRSLVFAYD
jgi:alkylated DNA repair protein alkB family protein 7